MERYLLRTWSLLPSIHKHSWIFWMKLSTEYFFFNFRCFFTLQTGVVLSCVGKCCQIDSAGLLEDVSYCKPFTRARDPSDNLIGVSFDCTWSKKISYEMEIHLDTWLVSRHLPLFLLHPASTRFQNVLNGDIKEFCGFWAGEFSGIEVSAFLCHEFCGTIFLSPRSLHVPM